MGKQKFRRTSARCPDGEVRSKGTYVLNLHVVMTISRPRWEVNNQRGLPASPITFE